MVCWVSKLSGDFFFPLSCNNAIFLFCLLSLKVCAHSVVLKRIVTIARLEAPNNVRSSEHFVPSENNTSKVIMALETNYSRWVLVSVRSDYLQQELALADRFGRRSGRGQSTGFHPWHYPWRGRLLSPLNETNISVIRINAAQEVHIYCEQMSFCLTYLQRSESWRACPNQKPCTLSFPVNS